MNSTLVRWGALALMIGTLAACGGGGGDDTTAAAPPAGGGGTTAAAPAVAVPTGTAPVTLTSTTPAATFAALAPVVPAISVSIASPPKVTFSLTDSAGNAIIGFGAQSKDAGCIRSGTDYLTVPCYPNLAFSLAKLVPGTNGSPSKWVSYIVTSVPTKALAATGSRPTTDNTGTLVDNKNGTYTYTFYRDITKVKDEVAAMTLTAPNVAADLGDLTYDPSLPHRLTIQISGNAPGTGTNTPTGVQVTTGVPMTNPVNAIYDFIPKTGLPVAATDLQRNVVSIDNCNECHEKLAFHGSARIDTKYCVVCHTDQRKYGYANVASTANAFPALKETATVNATTGITSYSYSPETRVADGAVSGDFPNLVHKIHQGGDLVKQNYNYANVAFNNKGFSMLGGGQRMCSKCHDSAKAAQADNWNTVPSRLACGACHDGINFATGTGTTLGGAATGHVGKAQSSDATCALCHSAADIKTYHYTENVTKHNPTVASGLANFSYEVKSAAVNATTNAVTVVFKVSKDGTALTTLAPTGFTGGPSFLLAWAETQDGIATPVDYNNTTRKQAQAISVSISDLLKGTGGSIAGPDSTGYFTATLTGTAGTNVFPIGAKMRAVALQAYYTQSAGTGGIAAATGRHTISAVKEVTGDTVRRKVVEAAKCSNCHEWFEGHGGNRVFAPESGALVCMLCHVPGMATSGRGISDTVWDGYAKDVGFSAADKKKLSEWGVSLTGVNRALSLPVVTNNMKDMIHGIHAGRDRVTPFKDARDRTSFSSTTGKYGGAITLLDFRRMDFPGKLNNCETCHIAGTYSNVPTGALASTYESIDAAYKTGPATPALAKTALGKANPEDKVTSPFAAACVSCHDSVAAQSHMSTQGGMIQIERGTAITVGTWVYNVATPGKGEACATCHGVGKAEDITVKHK